MKVWKKTNIANVYRNSISGIYHLRIYVGKKPNRRQTSITLETDDETTAKERATAARVKLESASTETASHSKLVTVGDAVALLRAQKFSLFARPVKPRTLAFFEERSRALFKSWPSLERTKLFDLTSTACIRWESEFKGSASTFNGTLLVFQLALRLASEHHALRRDPITMLQVNPLDKVRRRKIAKQKVPKVLSAAQFADVLRVMKCGQHATALAAHDLAAVMAFSGARVSEACGLRWQDCNFDTGRLTIQHQLSPDGRLVTPKNGETRDVKMHPSLRAVLLEIRNRAVAQNRAEPDDHIITVRTCRGAMKHATDVLGYPRQTHHSLRHFFASRCVEAGVDFKTLATWMGHKDGGILIGKTYSHLCADHEDAMAAKVDMSGKMNVVELPVKKAVNQ